MPKHKSLIDKLGDAVEIGDVNSIKHILSHHQAQIPLDQPNMEDSNGHIYSLIVFAMTTRDYTNNYEVTQTLLSYGYPSQGFMIDGSQEKDITIIDASPEPINMLTLLIEYGFDVNSTFQRVNGGKITSETPLIQSIYFSKSDLFQELLFKGADPFYIQTEYHNGNIIKRSIDQIITSRTMQSPKTAIDMLIALDFAKHNYKRRNNNLLVMLLDSLE